MGPGGTFPTGEHFFGRRNRAPGETFHRKKRCRGKCCHGGPMEMAFRNVPTGARRAPGGTFPSRRKMFLRGPDGGKTFHRGPDGGAGRGPGGTFPGRKRRGPTGKHLRGPRAPPRCCSAILRPPRRSSHSLVDSRFPVPTRVLPRPLSWVAICSDCLCGALTPRSRSPRRALAPRPGVGRGS